MINIEIHEFSTGILVEGNQDNWFSRGFTGQYMNTTLAEIPPLIQQAISNKEFAVTERAFSDQPALIARELDNEQEKWSVIAVITKAKDDFGRDLSVYRYFLTEGLGKIAGILRWMHNKSSVFNPFELREVGQSHSFSYDENTKIPIDNFQDLITEEIPLIIPASTLCNPLIINSIAEKKADNKLLAWAYNVNGLAVIKSFYVIYPAHQEVEIKLRQMTTNKSYTQQIIIGEEAIKKASISLISREEVKLEHLQTLEDAFCNQNIDKGYWLEIFDGRGAQNALKQSLYSEQMVRLLTLRAIALPETLPQFLLWMTQNKEKEPQNWSISLTLQANLLKKLSYFHQITNQIQYGVSLLLLKLLDKPELLNSVIYLLKHKRSIWAYLYQHILKQSLENDLDLISQFIQLQQRDLLEELEALEFKLIKNKHWELIFQDLLLFWPPNYQTFSLAKYQVWGDLFATLKHYQLSAIFYQISTDEVPKLIFNKIPPSKSATNLKTNIYGLPIYRQLNCLETIVVNLTERD
jgi:hypothetical protein